MAPPEATSTPKAPFPGNPNRAPSGARRYAYTAGAALLPKPFVLRGNGRRGHGAMRIRLVPVPEHAVPAGRAWFLGAGRRGVQRPGVERPGVERPGVEGPGVERPGVERPGVERPGVQRPGVQRHGVQRHGWQRVAAGVRMRLLGRRAHEQTVAPRRWLPFPATATDAESARISCRRLMARDSLRYTDA